MGGTRPPAWPSADDRLVDAVRRGDPGAFDRVYDRHARELHSFCRHMLGNSADAEDALQQTFLKAYRALRDSSRPIALRPWLFTIARNECLSVLRRRDPAAPVLEIGVTEGLAAQVEERIELREMLTDIARLPGEQREALLLSSIQKLSGEEVAEILGTDRDRVKALVYRARRSLAHKREARDTCCADVRAQLSVLRGGSLRRKVIREHLLECEGCRPSGRGEAARAAGRSPAGADGARRSGTPGSPRTRAGARGSPCA
jgi:RNA polymerase sigma factor (sigma-70 family)